MAASSGTCSNATALKTDVDDLSAIRTAALDYIEGWYAGDPDRMERALHPELAKRILRSLPNGGYQLDQMSALTLVQKTRAAIGKRDPGRQADVIILDCYQNAASVRVTASNWVDYLHLVRMGGQWKIVNVLWEIKSTT